MGVTEQIDSMKSIGVYYWYVKIPQWRYMDHVLKDIAFYVQKHIAPRICESRLYFQRTGVTAVLHQAIDIWN